MSGRANGDVSRMIWKGQLDFRDGAKLAWLQYGDPLPHNWLGHIDMLHANQVLLGDLAEAILRVAKSGTRCCGDCRFAQVVDSLTNPLFIF